MDLPAVEPKMMMENVEKSYEFLFLLANFDVPFFSF